MEILYKIMNTKKNLFQNSIFEHFFFKSSLPKNLEKIYIIVLGMKYILQKFSERFDALFKHSRIY